jgi:tRNA pseudouridine55 synthase
VSADGLLIVNKPCGPTSHDIVAQARRALGTRAVGHAGTLDPMASGVLVLLVGEATKLAAYLSLDEKRYRATVSFGRSTDTWDGEGTTTEERALDDGFPDPAALEAALAGERQRVEQIPPAFSAISIGGQRSHRLARRGKSVELPPRAITVRNLTLIDSRTAWAGEAAMVTLDATVSKGYYVRSLGRDLGLRLGVPSHLAALERTASGPYRIETAIAWPPAGLPELVSLESAACTALPPAQLNAVGEARARAGTALAPEHFDSPPTTPLSAWLGVGRRLVAIGRAADDGFRVVRGFRGDFQHQKLKENQTPTGE